MHLAAQEREKIQSNIQVQRQMWQQLNDLQRENQNDQRRYKQLEIELKRTEREIARLEALLTEPDEVLAPAQTYNQAEGSSTERDYNQPEYDTDNEFNARPPKKQTLPVLAIGGLAVVLLAGVGVLWILLTNTGPKVENKLPTQVSGNSELPGNLSNLVVNGNFGRELEGWEDKTGATDENSPTRSLFLEGIPAADNSGQRVLQLEHSGSESGFIAQTIKLESKRNLTFSAYLGGRADGQPVGKQGYAYLLVQIKGKNGTVLGGTIYQVAPGGFRANGLTDRNRYRAVELAASLTKYSFDLQSEANRLKINLSDIEAVTIQVQAGAVTPEAKCNQDECKAEIQVANVQLQ